MEPWLERYKGIVFFILVILALAAVVLIQVLRPSPQPIELRSATPLSVPEATTTPRPLRVYVSGAVLRPDVYTLPPDSIVKDAMMAAGGPAGDADLNRINLAAPVADGQQIYVPRQEEENPPVRLPSDPFTAGGKVDINTAGVATLESLPGIGPALAQRIVDYRQTHGPFTQPEEIMEVSGIGAGTFEKLRDLITTD